MRFISIFILGIASTLTLSAQKVDQIYRAKDASRLKPSTFFELIDPRTDIDAFKPIAAFKLTIEKDGKNNMIASYEKFKEKATKIGANSFTIDQVSVVHNCYIVRVSAYMLTKAQLKNNLRNYDRNYVAIIGSLDLKKNAKNEKFLVNGQECEIAPHSYMYLLHNDREHLEIQLESIDGPNLSLAGRNNKLASFLGKGDVFETTGIDLGTGFSTLNQEPKKKKEKKEKRKKISGIIEYDRPLGNFILIVIDNANAELTPESAKPTTSEQTTPATTATPSDAPKTMEAAPVPMPQKVEPKPLDAKSKLKEQLEKSRKK